MLKPRQPVPSLDVETVDGPHWKLSEQSPKNFTMIVAYRGLHCPICKTYLRDLDRHADEFKARGVEILTLSSDPEDRAKQAKADWEIKNTPLGYGLSIDKARQWGLYVSKGRGPTSIGIEEPAEFNEPGLFLVRPDGTLYWASVSTMPFARPHFKEVLGALDFAIEKGYPARGES